MNGGAPERIPSRLRILLRWNAVAYATVAILLLVANFIIGGGACGMAAALAVSDAGIDALVLERDAIAAGNTALSSGMIPACGTSQQRQSGIDDNVDVMCGDIETKARQQTDSQLVKMVCEASAPLVDWLVASHHVELTLVEGFVYPGHSRIRMHAPPSR